MSSLLSKLINLAGNITGTLGITNGGTGQTTANAALNALLPTQSGNAGKVLKTDATNTSWTAVATLPVSTDDVIGSTTGTPAASGYIGQVIESTSTSAFNSGTVTDATSVTLDAGIWIILASCTTPSANALTGLTCSISTTSATNDANNQAWAGAGSNNFVSAFLCRYVAIASNTTYYLTGNTTGTGPATSQKNKLTCIRIH